MIQMKQEAERILAAHGLPLPYPCADLTITRKCVYEPTWSQEVSTRLLEQIFPSMGAAEVLHFTKPHILPSILQNKAIWLASVKKNFDAKEYLAFIKQHGYPSTASKSIRRELASNYFYMSFTAVGSASAASHWNVFADGGAGYCLRFQITPKLADLRRIQYHSGNPDALTLLDNDLKAAIGRTFFPRGTAKVTAFSLYQNLAYEDEIRLLVSNPPAGWKFSSNGNDYISINLGAANPTCDVELTRIACGRAA
jgi:hypothetical protein